MTLYAFMLSICCGAGMLLLWDILGGMRRSFARGVVINIILDIIWWFASVSAFLWCMWRTVALELRFFEAFAVVLGAALYKFTLSRYTKRLFFFIFSAITKIIKLIFKILLTPAQFLYKIIYIRIISKIGLVERSSS